MSAKDELRQWGYSVSVQSAAPAASPSEPMACGIKPAADHNFRYGICNWKDMARKSFFAILGASILSIGFAQGKHQGQAAEGSEGLLPLRSIQHNAFQVGEKLEYVLHYGFMNAGVATVSLKESPVDMLGRKVLYASAEGHSAGAFKAFYKVNDLYESRFDKDGVFPWVFTRRCDEGGYIINQDYTFLQHRHQVSTQDKKQFSVPANVQDMISAFYYARTWDLSNVQPGQEFTMDVFIDNEIWPLRMRFIEKETIKIRNGKYRCLKFQPLVQKGRIFKSNDDLSVWITDDPNRIPVLVQAKILVGSIKMELSGYSGLANAIARE